MATGYGCRTPKRSIETMRPAKTPKLIAVPLILIAIVISLFFVRQAFHFPTDEELRPIIRKLFEGYGLLIVLASALIEGLFAIGWYFPGTTIILFCLLFAGDNPVDVLTIAIAASLGVSLAHAANYAIGRYGWYRLLAKLGFGNALERAKDRLQSHGASAIVMSYWQFSLASLTSTAAGILQMPATRFIVVSTLATFFWVGFWSTLIFALGSAAMTLIGLPFILAILLTWIVIAICASLIKSRNQR
jgi:membrane protein DedA with SNARE-associated domain